METLCRSGLAGFGFGGSFSFAGMGLMRFVLRVWGSGLGSGDIFTKVVLRRSRTCHDLPSQLRKNMENEMEALDRFSSGCGDLPG